MISIIKLKFLKLRDDIKIIGFMTALTLIMVAVFSSISFTQGKTTFGFIDEDQSVYSQNVLEKLQNLDAYDVEVFSLAAAEKAIKSGDIEAAFYLEQGFEAAVKAGEIQISKLYITENMSNTQMDGLLQGVVEEVRNDDVLIQSLKQVTGQEMLNTFVKSTLNEHRNFKQPIVVTPVYLESSTSYDSTKHSIVGFALFFAMFTIIFGIADILLDKQYHTWDRLMVSPISKVSILSGNLLMTWLVGFFQVSIIFILSRYLFGVDWSGQMIHLMFIVAAFVFCVTALGMLLSNFLKTMGQLSAISPILITGTAMIGGCFWPLEIVTFKPLLFLANFTPQKWAITGIERIAVYGYGLESVMLNILVLVGMGIVYLSLGIYLLNKRTA